MIGICLDCGAQCIMGRPCYFCESRNQEDGEIVVIKDEFVEGIWSVEEMEEQIEAALRRLEPASA